MHSYQHLNVGKFNNNNNNKKCKILKKSWENGVFVKDFVRIGFRSMIKTENLLPSTPSKASLLGSTIHSVTLGGLKRVKYNKTKQKHEDFTIYII